ncbi:MAG: SDR family NAD(P)-dependent oxidoreductase [Gammaproteobacteria bacterium]
MNSNIYDLKGRTAVVTGGASGIGSAIAQRLLASGARVAVLDRDNTAFDLDSLSASLIAIDVDVTDAQAVDAAAASVVDRFGSLDILVNSAGIAGANAPVWEYSPEEWRRVVDVDLTGTFIACRACIPHMLKNNWGRVVNIGSIAGKEGNANASAYSAAKAGVLALTKSLGKELAGTGIRVNTIAPAMVRTALFEQMTDEHVQRMIAKIPMGRPGTVEEIAALCMWLCSEECSFSTGAVFDASGGRAVY